MLPIPTDFAASKYFVFGISKFLFSNFLLIGYVNFVSDLVIKVPEVCDAIVVELCPLLSLYLLLISSWLITKNCSELIKITSSTLNFLVMLGSIKEINVVIPVAARFPIGSDKAEVIVDNPIVLIPSIFL